MKVICATVHPIPSYYETSYRNPILEIQ